jgi:hypothetical protein
MCVDYASMWTMIPMLLPMAWTLVLLYGCYYGLDYVELLWSELCACLCLLLRYIYGPLYVVSRSL